MSTTRPVIINQIAALNDLCQTRIRIMPMEAFFNHITTHYVLGFLYCYYLLRMFSSLSFVYPSFYLGVVGGWVFVDVVSYLLHMFIDSDWYDVNIARPVKDCNSDRYALVDDHHNFTLNYSYLNSVEMIAITYCIVIPVILPMLFIQYIVGLYYSPMWQGYLISTWTCGLMTGYAHRWAHERNHRLLDPSSSIVDRAIVVLQDKGVLLSAHGHRQHHIMVRHGDKGYFSLLSGLTDNIISIFIKIFNKLRR